MTRAVLGPSVYGNLHIATLLQRVQRLSLGSRSKILAHECKRVVAGFPSMPLANN